MQSDFASAPSERHARIFLLSHMRAFTSLAGHILGSHPQISGYYELHISYADAAALDRQRDALQDSGALKPGSRYLFDKLLHNEYALRPERLGQPDTKILVSLLEPEHAIKSIINLFARKEAANLYASPVGAAHYYMARLLALANFCRSVRQPYYYYDAGLFQRAPDQLLTRLSHWLELDSPLSERYQVFSQTGKPRMGDSSVRIHSGSIDRTPVDYSHVMVPERVLDRARELYRECRRQIIEKAAEAVLY